MEIKPNIQVSHDTSGKTEGPTAEAIYLKSEPRLNVRWLKHNSPTAWSETEASCFEQREKEVKGSTTVQIYH